jgi:hypothetical protein
MRIVSPLILNCFKIPKGKTMKNHTLKYITGPRTVHAFFLWLLLFLLPALSCSLPLNRDDSLQETQSALHVQETFAAEAVATNSAQELVIAATSTYLAAQLEISAQGTVQAQQATIAALESAASAQLTAQAEKPTDPPTMATLEVPKPTNTSSNADSDEIVITDWKMSRFAQITSGCYFSNELCWKGDDRYDYLQQQVNLVLTSRETIFVDPSWKNPTLTFWHTFNFPRPGSVNIQADGKWSNMANYSNNKDWHQVFIPLSLFSGKNITIQFLAFGKSSRIDPKADWYVQNIMIIPDYTP